jgi:hypothetical protein
MEHRLHSHSESTDRSCMMPSAHSARRESHSYLTRHKKQSCFTVKSTNNIVMRTVSPLLSLLLAFLIVDSAEGQQTPILVAVSQVQCSLSTSTAFFQYNETARVYVELADDNDDLDGSGTRRLRPRNGVVTQSVSNSNDTIHHVKACWCTQFYDRPMEYCPLHFDTCVVRGETGPVSCYSTSGAATFVRGFWPVAIFWFLGLLYGVFFTEPGGSFRDYLRRTMCLKCASKSSEELLKRDVDRLVTAQPERAVFLYRQALSRQRRESVRQQNLVQRAGLLHLLHTTPDDLPVALPVPAAVEASYTATGAQHPERVTVRTLALKTKVFRSSNSDDAAQRPVGPTPIQRSHVPQSTQTWLPSQFTREHVTLDEMDGELEQGVRCAICLDRLEQGDVVGDIPCEHVFHKDCLKDWLRKKNRCPLCQRSEVATPNF